MLPTATCVVIIAHLASFVTLSEVFVTLPEVFVPQTASDRRNQFIEDKTSGADSVYVGIHFGGRELAAAPLPCMSAISSHSSLLIITAMYVWVDDVCFTCWSHSTGERAAIRAGVSM